MILVIWRKCRKKIIPISLTEQPTISIIISAYNEENIIEEKIQNLKSLHYDKNRIEFLIGSDGSTDKTAEILKEHQSKNLIVYISNKRRGKPAILNELVQMAHGEIIVFSDANTLYQQDTIKNLVHHFSDPKVGAVCGRLVLESTDNVSQFTGEISYWEYENTIKKLESDIHSAIGANGAVYAIRRSLYKQLPTDIPVVDDLMIPLYIVEKGYVVKYEPNALAFEKITGTVAGEFKRKIRIGVANYYGLFEFLKLLHPRFGFVAFALISHKILRWFIPFFLIAIFISSFILAFESQFFLLLLLIEVIFIFIAIFGYFSESFKWQIGILGYPFYFIAMNTALFIGFLKFIRREKQPTWDVVR